MNYQKQHIISFLAKIPLLVLYVLFFAVQLFFNFDFGNQNVHIVRPVLSAKDNPKAHYSGCKKVTTPSPKKIHFRLNKRYQPQAAISCGTIVVEPLLCIVSSKRHVHYSRGFILFSLPAVHLLRGPPLLYNRSV